MADPLLGVMVGPYRVESVLGRGGMGVVYRAVDVRLGRAVALKLVGENLASDDTFSRRFLAEGQAAAALEHPNVVPVYDVGEHDGRPWLAMRLVDGQNLAELLLAGPLEPRRAVHLVGQVAAALDAMHARGQIHRDVKPENVLVGAGDHVMLSDFGLARAVEGTRLTQTGVFAASPAYASPEQLQGADVGPPGDQYALAGVLFTCLTGEEPFPRADVLAVLMAHASAPPPQVTERRPDLPSGIDEVVARGLAKEPAARFGSCGQLVDAAEAALLHPGRAPTLIGAVAPPPPRPGQPNTLIVPSYTPPPQPSARPPDPLPPAARRRSRWRPWHAVVAVAAVVSIIGAGTALAISRRDTAKGFDDTPLRPVAFVDHWHVAYGVYICDRWLDPVLDQVDPKGIHTHGDGIIHIHPFSDDTSGINARFGRFVEAIGASVSDTQLSWSPGDGSRTQTYKDGQSCGDRRAEVVVFYDGELYSGDPSFLLLDDRSKLVLAFVPFGTIYEEIGDPPSTPGLGTLSDVAPPNP